jgi:inner membrane protein
MGRVPWLVKGLLLVGVVVLLLLALARVGFLVDQRRAYQHEAEASVRQGLADPQVLLGPFLRRDCTEQWDVVSHKDGERSMQTQQRSFALTAVPARLAVSGDLAMEPRWRGLFKVNTYTGRLVVTAQWPQATALAAARQHPVSRLKCDAPILSLAMADARGIRSATLAVNDLARTLHPGTRHESDPRGFHALLDNEWSETAQALQPLSVRLALDVVGTGHWAVVPAAGQTEVALRADWPHPSFGGRFLPAERKVESTGFAATWRVSGLATDAAMALAKGKALCNGINVMGASECLDALSVAFIDPINVYTLSDRAIKYGLLFIVLTLSAVALMETVAARAVHPVQYLLVGAALVMFFMLLLSLSEHVAFAQAYAAAAGACVALLTYYAAHMLGHWRRGTAFGTGVAALYGAMYTLLQLEQTALVVGSLLLFAVLALVMIVTRRVDWYALFARPGAGAAAAAPVAR